MIQVQCRFCQASVNFQQLFTHVDECVEEQKLQFFEQIASNFAFFGFKLPE